MEEIEDDKEAADIDDDITVGEGSLSIFLKITFIR
jgi:hypothetical protein